MRRICGLQFLLSSVLLMSLSGCSDPEPIPDEVPVDTTAPVIIESS
jgi:hypothetical protein